MSDDSFFIIIRNYNSLMKSAIQGPNCIDPTVCRGDCCSIQIDVPKKLAKEYIRLGYATEEDFIRSDIFTFKLRFDEKKGKCFLFDLDLNGCSVHDSGIKPPQCWIYPTKFSNKNQNISCKKTNGWRIIDLKKTKEAKKLLKEYISLCEIEAKEEIQKIKIRLGEGTSNRAQNISKKLKNLLKKTAPKNFAGLKDSWDSMEILSAQGISLQLKKFCTKFNKNCKFLPDGFLSCQKICHHVRESIIAYFKENIVNFIKKNGPDNNGEYSLYNIRHSLD
ncbi:MAG: YkgJ family cysteine cluster protein [Promethearchaeota archaeon]